MSDLQDELLLLQIQTGVSKLSRARIEDQDHRIAELEAQLSEKKWIVRIPDGSLKAELFMSEIANRKKAKDLGDANRRIDKAQELVKTALALVEVAQDKVERLQFRIKHGYYKEAK